LKQLHTQELRALVRDYASDLLLPLHKILVDQC